MAVQVSDITNVAQRYPVVSCGLLLLLAFPVYQLFVYFFPLFISTALCVAALVTAGAPALGEPGSGEASGKDIKDESWLGRMRCLQEFAKEWLECKLRVRSRAGGLPETGCPEESLLSPETEHEKRVLQLERTLRTLSFVSYEGIFSTDGTLVDLDEETPSVSEDQAQSERPAPRQPKNGPGAPEEVDASSDSSSEQVESMSEGADASSDSSAEQVETGSQGSSSWQEVESDTAQQSPA